LLAAPFVSVSALAQQSGQEAQAIERLKAFLVQAVGQPIAERRAIAQRSLAAVDPRSDLSLLVEIAAIGMLVRSGSTSEALRSGYPKRSRFAIDTAEKRFGGAGWTKALAGAWHYEILRRSSIGAMIYGASRDKGDALFKRARELDRGDPGITLAYAVAMLGDDADEAAPRVVAMLAATPAADATPYGTLVAIQNERIVRLLRTGRNREAVDYALNIF